MENLQGLIGFVAGVIFTVIVVLYQINRRPEWFVALGVRALDKIRKRHAQLVESLKKARGES